MEDTWVFLWEVNRLRFGFSEVATECLAEVFRFYQDILVYLFKPVRDLLTQ